MENQGYYIRVWHKDKCCDHDEPLIVNCAGYTKMNYAYVTQRHRPDWMLQLMDVGTLITLGKSLEAGQFVIRRPDNPYEYEALENKESGYYWAHFTGGLVETFIVKNKIEPERIYTLRTEVMQDLRKEFGRLFREIMLRRPGFEQMAVSLLMSIFVRLGRGVLRADSKEMDCDLRNRLEQSVAYIHSHYTENISISTLAAMEYLSDSRFREVFRETFGMPPSEFIIRLRISRACELLQVSDLSVTQVAEICGYQDPLYFSRLFYKKMGISPQSYRKNSRSE